MTEISNYVKLDLWVKKIIVDPLSKKPMREIDGYLILDYGKKYPLVYGLFYDFRLFNIQNVFSKLLR